MTLDDLTPAIKEEIKTIAAQHGAFNVLTTSGKPRSGLWSGAIVVAPTYSATATT
jgi:hypothetical protein